MKKVFFIKLVSILVIFSTLILPFTDQPVFAQNDFPITNLSISFTENQPLPETPETDLWVVRVYFTTRQEVADIAAWVEPWEVNYKDGYLVVGVSQAGYKRLLAGGYRVEIDHDYTASVNQPLEYLPMQVNGIPGYPCYRTVEETFATAADIAANYPALAEWIDIGDSWEKVTPGGNAGYDMMVLRLTNEAITIEKPKLFIMTAVHAREYTTAELNTRFAEYLIANYNIDPDVTWLLDATEIHLLLQANPDGRKYAEQGHYQRKNTNNTNGGSCYVPPIMNDHYGTDLNRNFAFEWGAHNGSSPLPCDQTYRGPTPASESETQAIQNYVSSIFPDQRGDDLTDPAPDDAMGIFLDIHSYSELVLWPWGFTYTAAPNGTALQTLGRKFAYFNAYEPVQAVGLYPTDGTTDDFAYGELGLAAYTFELGTRFFQDCSIFENTILPDNLPALIYAAKTSRTPYMTPAGPDALEVTALPNMIAAGNAVTLTATINDTRYNDINGAEPSQNIAAAEYYIDTPPWEAGAVAQTMSTADGNFNAPIEDVTAAIDTAELSAGRHIIFVRGQDANGNWGAVSAVFVFPLKYLFLPIINR